MEILKNFEEQIIKINCNHSQDLFLSSIISILAIITLLKYFISFSKNKELALNITEYLEAINFILISGLFFLLIFQK